MQHEATASAGGLVVADGYGLKVCVQRGHLIVEDGVGRDRRTVRLNRATSRLKRLIVIGHTGFITFEALRWIDDVGAAFAQIGRDGELIAVSAPARHHESKLRRAQALAVDSPAGKTATVELLQAKLRAQADVAHGLRHLKATVRVKDATPVTVADAIREYADQLDPSMTFARMREIESAAGRNYWQTWARVTPNFAPDYRVPDHWATAGPRTSWVDRKRARKAASPVHAILNYTYALLEVEATIACHALGFDPSLGIMHADHRYRGSLATDLMEPVRPVADAAVLALLNDQTLGRDDVFENREGVCRVGHPLTRRLAAMAPALRRALAPHGERLAAQLLKSDSHPTPLTRTRHRRALAEAIGQA